VTKKSYDMINTHR